MKQLPAVGVIAIAVLFGCRSLSKSPDTSWMADLSRADSIEFRTTLDSVRVEDPDVIRRLASIHQSAKWTPHWHTLPNGVGDRAIYLYSDDIELRHFLYNGRLWEANTYDDLCAADVSPDDQAWIESRFPNSPQAENDG